MPHTPGLPVAWARLELAHRGSPEAPKLGYEAARGGELHLALGSCGHVALQDRRRTHLTGDSSRACAHPSSVPSNV